MTDRNPTPGGSLQTGVIVKILPTRIWIESDITGARHVMMQHEGCEPFTFASFHYNYAYTSNSTTLEHATRLALSLGATEPVEQRQRDLDDDMPSADEVREQIQEMQAFLTELESKKSQAPNA